MQPAKDISQPFSCYPLSECAITVEFGNEISEAIFLRVNQFKNTIDKKPFPGMRTTVPAYATVTIFFDPVMVFATNGLHGFSCFERVRNYVESIYDNATSVEQQSKIVTIPVCYGGIYGPDLELVATHHQITTDEVIRLHSQATYKVYMLGFMPGFAYLGGLPERLYMPRKAEPRTAVPTGSVGLAGEQTGVYPFSTPGGWQLIGRTPLKMFDTSADELTLLKAGDQVIFQPVTETEFKKIDADQSR